MGRTMQYQDGARTAQAGGDLAAHLADANINPATGLSTDYLNHFNEAIMLLDMLPDCPECRDDFLAWQPRSYREHFAASRFNGRALAIAAYDGAEPLARENLDKLADAMTTILQATHRAMSAGLSAHATAKLAAHAAGWLKPLVMRAGAAINGELGDNPLAAQSVVDGLFRR